MSGNGHSLDAIEQAKKTRFLEAFGKIGIITVAAHQAEIGRTTHYNWLKDDPEYVERFKEKINEAADRLEGEAHRRAVLGVEKPVFGSLPGVNTGSGQIGVIREYSDTLLIVLLKMRGRFKDRGQHINIVSPLAVQIIMEDGG